jgi:glycopeptide antibiotics resistance protein
MWQRVGPLLPLIPLGLVLVGIAVVGLALLRTRRGRSRSVSLSSSALDVSLVASIVAVLSLTLSHPIGVPSGAIVLIPFSEFRYAATADVISQLLGNVILFMPLGFLAPLRWRRLDSVLGILIGSTAFSVSIELLQLVLPARRQASLTDVLMNVVGGALGYVLMRVVRGFGRRVPAATTHR